MHNVWDALSASPVSPPASNAAIAEELRMLMRSGRLRDCWHMPPEAAFAQLGFDSSIQWSDVGWYGPLEIWRDPEHGVSDILFNGPPDSPFFVVQRGMMVNTGVMVHPAWIDWTQRQLVQRSHSVNPELSMPSFAQGVVDGLRYAITDRRASPAGPSLSIRVLPERWATLDDLVQSNVISREASDLLLAALSNGASLLIAGPTGSGKTTLAAALIQVIGARMRLVVIEDGGELPRSANSLHMEAPTEPGGFSRVVTFALRQKPNYIIVGEVRGGEAMAILQAAATGHPGLGTIHAATVQGALRNLERMALIGLAHETTGAGQAAAQIVRGLITSDVVNLVVVQIGRAPNGKRGVLAIEEVLPQGAQGQSGDPFPTNPLFRYDRASERLTRAGYVNAAWGLGRM
ncbi:CpaF/VirB11 family protein [Chloroflexus sp.]|uniref:CpaF/VirB11 family protein n=1 Tax=Chloroflexus sp. TaxID=1904827 RepID=UPI002625C773|nr:CpaF/VirB11 family protein [uncultured Chloroflexus sp.]